MATIKNMLVDKIIELIKPTVNSMGYRLFKVSLQRGKKMTLQIMIDKLDNNFINTDDCSKISTAISSLLDVEDIIDEAYYLEISSPGIDRELIEEVDYINNLNMDAKIEVIEAIDSQKKFKGQILDFKNNIITLALKDANICIDIANVFKAKLILNDKLIKKYQGD